MQLGCEKAQNNQISKTFSDFENIWHTSEILIVEFKKVEQFWNFLKLSPNIAVITNIDIEHLETYGSKRNIIKAFTEFSNKTSFFG